MVQGCCCERTKLSLQLCLPCPFCSASRLLTSRTGKPRTVSLRGRPPPVLLKCSTSLFSFVSGPGSDVFGSGASVQEPESALQSRETCQVSCSSRRRPEVRCCRLHGILQRCVRPRHQENLQQPQQYTCYWVIFCHERQFPLARAGAELTSPAEWQRRLQSPSRAASDPPCVGSC